MTVPQFKFLIQPGQLLDSLDRVVNVCYTGSNIQAIAIRIGEVSLTRLQQATTIVLKAPQTGNTLNISLESTQTPVRTVDREQVGNYYMYTILQQDQQPVMSSIPTPTGTPSVENYFTEVIILPTEEQSIFIGSINDVLVNNAIENRTSTYIQVSDRASRLVGSTNPVNISSIRNNTAIKASIQDSNYQDTGWSNGRYSGTLTDSLTFGGIDPATNGTSFTGAIFASGLSTAEVLSTVSQGITYSEYFFKGSLTYPTFISELTNLQPNATVIVTQTYMDLKATGAGVPYIPKIGDILIVTLSGLGSIADEYMKVTAFENVGGPAGRIYVERGWGGTPIYEQTATADIYRITPVEIFKIEQSKLQGVEKGKLYVKDSGEVLLINTLGYLVTGSAL